MRLDAGDETIVDRNHARTESNPAGAGGCGDSGVEDAKRLDSTGFDLADGQYELVGRQLRALMGYDHDDFPGWADVHSYQHMLDRNLTSHPGDVGAGGGRGRGTEPVLEGVGRLADDDTVAFGTLFAGDDRPLPATPGGAVAVTVLDAGDDVLESRTYPDRVEFRARTTDPANGHFVTEDVFAFAVPFPERTAAVEFERDGTVTRLNPVERSVREAIDRLPDAAFTRSPADRRAAFDDKLDAVAEIMAEGGYRAAKRKMEKDIRDKVEKWIRDGYEAGPLEPTKRELLDLVDDMIARLRTLARSDGRGD
jgi:hypothetical protein